MVRVATILACLLLVAWIVVTASRPPLGPPLLVLGISALLLELRAVPMPGLGLFSAAGACYVAAALVCGPLAAAGMALCALAARGVLLGHWRQMPADLLPALAAAGAGLVAGARPLETLAAVLPSATAIAYGSAAIVAHRLLVRDLTREERLEWLGVAPSVALLQAAVGLAGAGLGVAVANTPWAALWLVPLLWASHLAAANAAHRAHGLQVETAREKIAYEVRRLDRDRGFVEVARRQMLDAIDERQTLEAFTRRLSASADMRETLELILDEASASVPFRSLALFLRDGQGNLSPAIYRSPDRERLESAALLRAEEPVVEVAWRKRATTRSSAEMRPKQRLFPDEASAVAVFLQGEGVLYVGRLEEEAYSDEALHRLTVLAGQASLGLQSARRFEDQRLALELHADAHARLEGWVTRLQGLLDGFRDLSSTLDSDAMLAALEPMSAALVPHEAGIVLAGAQVGREASRGWGTWPVDGGEATLDLMNAVAENRRPLLLDDVHASRFTPPAPHLTSLLAVPLLTRQRGTPPGSQAGGVFGVIVLGSSTPAAFTREHQDLLFVLACQAAVALSNARLFADVLQSRGDLEASQQQLVQSSKMAAVGQLAAGVAHEINSPLGAIILAIEAAETRLVADPEAAGKRLQRARKAAERARHIIEKLLLYSRGGGDERRALDLNVVVDETTEFLSHQLRLDGIDVHRDLLPVPEVMGSPNELQQVLVNLILNAKDATTNGNGRIRVFTRSEGGEAMMGVQDWGEGISAENLPRIFEPFFTAKPVGKGTGLGLSVSHQIVEQHGGTFDVVSKAGEGSTFTVRLPVLGGSHGS